MEIRNVTSIFFSPTGSTRRLVSMLSKTFPSKPREVDITPYTQRGLSMDFGPDDLVLFGVPVYGGRIPSPAVQTLRRMQGSRTPAVLVAAYGNREYDDALLELADIAAANGFIPFAAAALIAEHSIMHSVAAGRPDAQDAKKIEAFGTQLWKKLSTSEAALSSFRKRDPPLQRVWRCSHEAKGRAKLYRLRNLRRALPCTCHPR